MLSLKFKHNSWVVQKNEKNLHRQNNSVEEVSCKVLPPPPTPLQPSCCKSRLSFGTFNIEHCDVGLSCWYQVCLFHTTKGLDQLFADAQNASNPQA